MKHEPKYYVGQKLLCIDEVYIWEFKKGHIYTIISISDLSDYSDRPQGIQYCFQEFGPPNDYNEDWFEITIDTYFENATKYNSELEFNSKFDDFLSRDD